MPKGLKKVSAPCRLTNEEEEEPVQIKDCTDDHEDRLKRSTLKE